MANHSHTLSTLSKILNKKVIIRSMKRFHQINIRNEKLRLLVYAHDIQNNKKMQYYLLGIIIDAKKQSNRKSI